MIRVAIEIREDTLIHRTRVTAPSIEFALKIASGGKPGRRVRLVLPIEPAAFFVTEVPSQKEAA